MSKKRKAGQGTVRKRKDGRWEGRIVIGYNEKNLPITKNVLAKTKKECLEKLEELKAENIQKTNTEIKSDSLFGEWIDFWYQNYAKMGLRESSQEGYESRIYKHIIPNLGHIPLNKLTQNDFKQFYAKEKQSGRLQYTEFFGEGLSDRMIRAIHGNCRSALQKAVEIGLIAENPTVGCKIPPKKTREMQVLDPDEMQRLLIQAKYEGFFEIIALALMTGMRRGEICGLQWDDINFETRELTIKRQVSIVRGKLAISEPKTPSSLRTFVLPESLINALAELKKNATSEWVFESPVKKGMPRDPNAVYKMTQKILERAGCKKVRFHDLRHTFATTALANGMKIKQLSAMIGHISTATTLDIYLHSTIEMKKQVPKKIEQSFGKNERISETLESEGTPNTLETEKTKFEPKMGKYRKPGTGCISQINDNLFEGRYSPRLPNGKRISRNIYAHTREECEEKLAEMIKEMKAEINELREQLQKEQDMDDMQLTM